MNLLSLRGSAATATVPPSPGGAICGASPSFEVVYEENLRFVWRAARRLGIDAADTDDVVQDVFVVAHRKLPEFEGRAQIRTWLYRILVGVVRHYFRGRRRKPGNRPAPSPADVDVLRDHQSRGPHEAVERADAVRILDRLLARLDDEKREVFVLAEIEQLSSVEIAEVLGVNVNTVYSRLRVARQEFERALLRFRTHEVGGMP